MHAAFTFLMMSSAPTPRTMQLDIQIFEYFRVHIKLIEKFYCPFEQTYLAPSDVLA